MQRFFRGRVIGTIIVFALLGIGLTFFYVSKDAYKNQDDLDKQENLVPKYEIIGKSVEGRNIEAYTYGSGETRLIFVGGMHGGYEWNSVLLAYEFFDYLKTNPKIIPDNISVSIIPSANPDGVYKISKNEGRFDAEEMPEKELTKPGRFNANGVDLNRNFDCKWQSEAVWQGNPVSAGSKAFSEPESQALKDFILENNPTAIIFWHSQSNAVYASECEDGILPETLKIMDVYSKASEYPAIQSFDSYTITGDAEGWLASIDIPAITVELKTHETIEWAENLKGIKALFNYYKQQDSEEINLNST